MPAVQLARLRIQTTRLAESFDDSLKFSRGLDSLLELYGNRSFRPGYTASDRSRLPTYNVPPLVMRQLEIELGRVCAADSAISLEIIDQIWQSEILEMRQIAIYLLSQIPPAHLAEVLTRLRNWCTPSEDENLVHDLLLIGGRTIRKVEPETWLGFTQDGLRSTEPRSIIIGLNSLEPFLDETRMEYLPQVFKLLEPLVEDPPPAALADLEAVLLQIYAISPMETQSFIRKNLETKPHPQFIRLVRRLIPNLSTETQHYLRSYFLHQDRDTKNL
jgi:hypothetical protein